MRCLSQLTRGKKPHLAGVPSTTLSLSERSFLRAPRGLGVRVERLFCVCFVLVVGSLPRSTGQPGTFSCFGVVAFFFCFWNQGLFPACGVDGADRLLSLANSDEHRARRPHLRTTSVRRCRHRLMQSAPPRGSWSVREVGRSAGCCVVPEYILPFFICVVSG